MTGIRTIGAAELAAECAEGRAGAAVAELMTSLATGFVYVANPLTDGLVDRAYQQLQAFFALDPGTKDGYAAAHLQDNGGYRGISTERAEGAAVADWKELFQWCTELPAGHPLRERYPHRYPSARFPEAEVPGIADTLRLLQKEMLDCQRAVVRAIVLGLGAAPSAGDDLLADADVVTRALHYPPLPGAGTTWAAAHTDINLITVLPPATVPGLEVETVDGWIAADPPAGCLVLNTGAMFERVSNGLVPAGVHRVLPPEPGTERWSIAQFCHPAPWTVLGPLQSTVTADNPQRSVPQGTNELLERVIWEIRSA